MEHSITFKGEMVKAILAEKKTQTRRIIKPGQTYDYRYGRVGDRLWVREGLTAADNPYGGLWCIYRADSELVLPAHTWDWKGFVLPAMYMPRWACRIMLEIKRLRIEKLSEVRPHEVKKEGFETMMEFVLTWDSINGRRGKEYSYFANPWVVMIEFERLDWPLERIRTKG